MVLDQPSEADAGEFRSIAPAPTGGTAYHGPVVVTTLEFGGRAIRLVRPADPDRMLDDPGVRDWNRRDDYMPYWAYLWPAAYLLAEAVVRTLRGADGDPADRGTGDRLRTGPGRAGRPRTSLRVQFSDYDPAPLDFVARSAAENGFDRTRFTTRQLDWRNLPAERYPVILGADVIYEARLVPLVADVLGTMLVPGGLGLIGSPYRVAAQGFPAAIAAQGIALPHEPATSQTEDGPIRGTIYRVTWPKTPGSWAKIGNTL